MENKLSAWLAKEIKDRGWSSREVARRTGVISHTTVADVINGQRAPTYDFCAAIAPVFGQEKETLFRWAGLLPPLLQPTKEEREVLTALRDLSPETRAVILQIIRSLKSTSNLLQSTGQSAIMANNPLPPNLPTLDDEIRQFLVDFPELRSIMEEAQEHLSDVAIRALMANVKIVISNPAERLRFIEFHKELSAVFDVLASTA